MFDYINYLLHEFYSQNNWKESDYLSNLNLDSDEILHFSIPKQCELSLGKSITSQLKSFYSLGIPQKRSLGFAYTSHPISIGSMPLLMHYTTVNPALGQKKRILSFEEYRKERIDVTDFLDLNTLVHQTNEKNAPHKALVQSIKDNSNSGGAYLLHGRVFETLKVEALCSKFIGSRTLCCMSGLSDIKTDHGHFNFQLFKKFRHMFTEFMYTTDDQTCGVSLSYNIPQTDMTIGTEAFYTGKEKSGGLAFAARYRHLSSSNAKTAVTLITNPIMGHLSTSYTTHVSPELLLSSRYTINYYSYESDLMCGLHYVPQKRNIVVKFRLGVKEGLSFCLEGMYYHLKVGVGLMTEFTYNPRRSFGFEVQIS